MSAETPDPTHSQAAPAAIRLVEFRPGLWLVEAALDEFAVRGAVLVGSRRILVWDTLSHPRDMAPVRAQIAPLLAQGRELWIAYSHADWDHVWGTSGLPAPQAIVAHNRCRTRFAEDVPATLAQMAAEQTGRWDDVTLIPPGLTFARQFTLELGDGLTVELHHLPGHTDDCLVAFVPAWGLLLVGDTVETPFPLLGKAEAVAGWMRLLQGWADDPRVETVIPCHGEIGDRALIRRNLAYLDALRRGEDPTVGAAPADEELDSFYGQSHQENLRKARTFADQIRPATDSDRPRIDAFIRQMWGSDRQVMNGDVLRPADFPALLAVETTAADEAGTEPITGLLVYRLVGPACQVLLLNSVAPGRSVAHRLLDGVVDLARAAGCRRVTVVTTNDNLPALRLYQRYGFALAELRPGAVDAARALKPEIPTLGVDGIPLRDELELELSLT